MFCMQNCKFHKTRIFHRVVFNSIYIPHSIRFNKMTSFRKNRVEIDKQIAHHDAEEQCVVEKNTIKTFPSPTAVNLQQKAPSIKFFDKLPSKWTTLPVVGLGVAVYGYGRYRNQPQKTKEDKYVEPEPGKQLAKDWQVTCYRMMPLRPLSRTLGWVNSINLPVWIRWPLLQSYANIFQCNMKEAEVEDLQRYRNFGEFFRRGLKPGARPISFSDVVSPADGIILHCGKVETENVEQVKGVTYSLPTFLGPQTWNTTSAGEDDNKKGYVSRLLKNKENCLYQCVIYLAPGDYHRFHSPVEWTARFRRHFAGELLSVNPRVARWISGLFSLNERVVYVGDWEHGFFSYSAVGATSVGSIRIYQDRELRTNSSHIKKGTFLDKQFDKPMQVQKGSQFGEFNLGSTIVLVFEAPPDFQFVAESGSKVRVGGSLFDHNIYKTFKME